MNRIALFLAAAVPLFACDNPPEKRAIDEKPQASKSEAPPKKPEEAPPTAARPIPATDLSERPLHLFRADTAATMSGSWHIAGTTVSLRAEPTKKDGDTKSFDVRIIAAIAGASDQEVFACKALRADAAGRVEALLRGDKVHLLCINPPHEQDKGATEAVRLAFDDTKQELTPSGSYNGEGVVDPDTIDLDESEDG
jgi:hypothetical protein